MKEFGVMMTRADALDDALERFAGWGYLDVPGFAFHGPMGAEVLSTLGHDELVGSWVEAYKARYQPLEVPPRTEPLDAYDESSWQRALGDASRVADWADMFERELQGAAWQDVLRRWVPVLLSGYGGGLTHGLLRVAHAVRAFPVDGTGSGLLVEELAKGLASWAAAFKMLPGQPQLRGPLSLDEAVLQLPRPHDEWSLIEAGSFARMGEVHDFPAAIEALRAPNAVDDALSDLSATFCRTMLASPEVFAVPLVHTVTPIAAARSLVPLLPELPLDVIYARLWQVSAAIVTAFTPPPAPERFATWEPTDVPTISEVVARALEHQDVHALKFTEACAREYALRPDPVYLLAAQHVLTRLPPWSPSSAPPPRRPVPQPS
jgi:Questin oxidase-like